MRGTSKAKIQAQKHHKTSRHLDIYSGGHHLKQLEPQRRSVLDCLKENFRVGQRITFVHRMIYVGETTTEDVDTSLKDILEKIIKSINEHYCDEKITGYLFYHMRYFCHVVDGSEESLIKHLKLLFVHSKAKTELGRMKLLIIYHHVNQRILDEWMSITGKPPTLLERMNVDSDLKQTMDKLKYCIEKLYGLGLALRPVDSLDIDEDGQEVQVAESSIKKDTFNMYGQLVNPIYPFLPELSVLEFLLNSNYMRDVRQYLETYGSIPFMADYEDLAWPPPYDYVPMTVFLEEIDPVTDLTIQVPP